MHMKERRERPEKATARKFVPLFAFALFLEILFLAAGATLITLVFKTNLLDQGGVLLAPEHRSWEIGLWGGVCGLLHRSFKKTHQLRLRCQQALKRNDSTEQHFFLYLRPFRPDNFSPDQDELDHIPEVGQKAMRRCGRDISMLTVFDPNSRLPLLGPRNVTVKEHTRWQSHVDHLAQRSLGVILTPGGSSGIRWELDRIVALGMLPKTLVFLPTGMKRRGKALECLSQHIRLDPSRVPADAVAVTFPDGVTPYFFLEDVSTGAIAADVAVSVAFFFTHNPITGAPSELEKDCHFKAIEKFSRATLGAWVRCWRGQARWFPDYQP